ncbi:MAG TPA: cyanophycin synthetase [Lacipirellulaceae bacterium]|nr:cyanophycin synthetase [Lacipirellulaceae bacterium]
MQLKKVFQLRGPNIWANFPVLEVWVDLEEFKDTSSEMIPGFNDRLMRWLPSMIEHRCSIGERGGFFERLRRGTYMGHILEHTTLELQSLAGNVVGFGRARETSTEGLYKVAIEYLEEDVAMASLNTAFRLLMAAVHDHPFDVDAEIAKLREIARDVCLGPSTAAIVEAAKECGIPSMRLNSDSLVQLGYGARQRRICAAETDRTGAIAESIASDKHLTRTLLKTAGVPVPEGRPVTDVADALDAAEDLGGPVVVKPLDGNHGRGVATNLTTREQIIAAYEVAIQEGSRVVVEQHITGEDYRLLVVGNRLIAAAHREPAHVIGDGHSTIRQLVDEVNRDPQRSDGHGSVLSSIKLDATAIGVLKDQGHEAESIPAAGTKVLIRRNGNLSTGGTATDVTELVHPEVARRVVDAVQMVGLDIAGVDVIAKDISRPLREQGGAVIEVNAGPGLRMHLSPSKGTPQPVGKAIIEMMFPESQDGRIPIVAVTGVNGKTTTTRLLAHIVATTGKKVGMACTDGVYLAGERIDEADCSGPISARAILMNPQVEVAVLETARGGILREGLGFDRCDIAVVTNIGEGDHLGQADIQTTEQLAKVKRAIVEAMAPSGSAVLNAEDPLVAEMAKYCPGKVVFFANSGSHPLIVQRRSEGARVAFIRDHAIALAEGQYEFTLLSLDRIPLTFGGRIGFQVENVLAATAACWALGLPAEQIRLGLESFSSEMDKVPARFNVFQIAGATVIVDYGHNPSSLSAILSAIESFPAQMRTAVYSVAGDRRDCDITRQGELLGGAFDRVLLYEDHYLRGRSPGEIIGLLRAGLANSRRAKELHVFNTWTSAADAALRLVRPGELLLVQADVVDQAVNYLKAYITTQMAAHRAGAPTTIDTGSGINGPTTYHFAG